MKKMFSVFKPVFLSALLIGLYLVAMLVIKIYHSNNYEALLCLGTLPTIFFTFYIWKKYFIDNSNEKGMQLFQYSLFLWTIIQQYAIEYELLEKFHKGSFLIENATENLSADLTYYSVVTIATVGYGDILPVTKWAKYLTMMEVLTGVLLLIVIISNFHIFFKPVKDIEIKVNEKV